LARFMNSARVRRWGIAAAVILLATGLALAKLRRSPVPDVSELAAIGLAEHSLKVDGIERWFLVQPPSNAKQAAPVLIILHGGTQSMRRMFNTSAGATRGLPELARRENVLLLAPNGVNPDNGDAFGDNQNWNDLRQGVSRDSDADDVGFILAMIDWAQAHHRVDASRIYVTGASNGGMMTMRLLMEAPERFAAGAAFVSALPLGDDGLTPPKVPTPLMIANGTLDPLVKWNGGKIAGNRGTTRSVEATVAWWTKSNRATAQASEVSLLPDKDPKDGCRIETSIHAAEPGGAPVFAVKLTGGGHSIPSAKFKTPDTWLIREYIGPICKDVEGAQMIWDFLSKYRR
jgi:polyhydroxybutyrate depolymerase